MSDQRRFSGKKAFITGASKGLGRAIALRLAREGCDVAVGWFTRRQDAEETAQAIEGQGARALLLRGNIARTDHLERMFSGIADSFGGLDYFISNAAAGALKPALELSGDDWNLSIDSIARALLTGAQLAAPLMRQRGGGAILAMASLGAWRVMPHYSAIGAAKAAMESLVKYLAVELAPQNIRVNAVSAGVTDTRSLGLFPRATEMKERARAMTPGGLLTDPDDVAAAAAFLLSEDARWIVGQTLVVDGGLTLSF
jgi:enoyl-[acyl-carrier protein] reductase III